MNAFLVGKAMREIKFKQRMVAKDSSIRVSDSVIVKLSAPKNPANSNPANSSELLLIAAAAFQLFFCEIITAIGQRAFIEGLCSARH